MSKRNAYERDEIVLCAYAAIYDLDEIGGINAIHSLRSRSRSSIRMKIKNIVAMCDEVGRHRNPNQKPLSGRPPGESGRRTDWDLISQYFEVPRDEHLKECQSILELTRSGQ